LQSYSVAAAYAPLEIGTALTSTALSLDGHWSQTVPVSTNFVTGRCAVALFGSSSPKYALQIVSLTVANSFDVM
jgi:hypothetical protein